MTDLSPQQPSKLAPLPIVYNEFFNIANLNAVLFVETVDVAALRNGAMRPERLISLPVILSELPSWNMVPNYVSTTAVLGSYIGSEEKIGAHMGFIH